MPPQIHAEPVALRPLLWSTAAFGAAALLHIDRIPLWALAVLIACAAWQLSVAAGRVPMLPKAAQLILTFVLVSGVVVTFHAVNGLTASTVLLIVMGSIKLLETQDRRDRSIVIGAACFLLLAACLDRQSLARAPLYLGETTLACTALCVSAYGGEGLDARTAFRLAAGSLLLALPVALVFFLFFPRLAGGFWALPASDTATTGLGESMSPGSIAQLTASYEPAFRVRFSSAIPPAHERYWRGPVLHDFDGYTWRHGARRSVGRQGLRYWGVPYDHTVTLVPGAERSWFALDTIVRSPDTRVFFSDDYDLIAREPVTQSTTYHALSFTHTESAEPLAELSRQRDTALPDARNPRTRELAARLRAGAAADTAFVRAAIDYLRSGGFRYSLTPPTLDSDSVDDFLFHTREGFCGHYASAFVALMRAGGIPAHVVTGYLGGEWNPVGGYLLVRQSDAHAWGEVWIEGHGWRRVDPTAIIAPARLRRGILDILPDAVSGSTRLLHATPWLVRLAQSWDALNSAWNERVVKFDVDTQLGMLERLGMRSADWTGLVAALGSGLVAWLAWIAWRIGRSGGPRPADPLARAYHRLCRNLARAGVAREMHEGPLDYAEKVARRRPDLALRVRPLLARYAQLRYGPCADSDGPAAVELFARTVRRCRIPPPSMRA